MKKEEKKQIVKKIIIQILEDTFGGGKKSTKKDILKINLLNEEHLDDLWEEINSVFDLDFNFDEANTKDGMHLIELIVKEWDGETLAENVNINLKWIPFDYLGEDEYEDWIPWEIDEWNLSDKSVLNENE